MELIHKYPEGVHILNTSVASSLIEKISNPETKQPYFTTLVKKAYTHLFDHIVQTSFPVKLKKTSSRMAGIQKEGHYHTTIIDNSINAVCVDLVRAGMVPSQLFFEQLHMFLPADNIRQDHVYAARKTNEKNEVIGIDISGSKIGGPIENSVVLIADPMGATGSTISETIKIYKESVQGQAIKFITAHLIITPEYIKKVKSTHPEVEIFALRLDRGLSSKEVLDSVPGTHWEKEVGLNEHQYIVPGAGGVGEILNNSFV